MSLRDAFVAKGLVSKKRAREVSRELKEERKQAQGHKKSKKARRAEQQSQAARAEAAAKAERTAAREADAEARDAHEMRYRVRDLVRAHRLGGRGPIPFHHRSFGSSRVGTLQLRESLARDLRAGRAAVAAYVDDDGTTVHAVIGEAGARKLDLFAPEALVHWVRDPSALDDPAEVLGRPAGEVDLRAHRVRSGDSA